MTSWFVSHSHNPHHPVTMQTDRATYDKGFLFFSPPGEMTVYCYITLYAILHSNNKILVVLHHLGTTDLEYWSTSHTLSSYLPI